MVLAGETVNQLKQDIATEYLKQYKKEL